jgi:hypothetical protein
MGLNGLGRQSHSSTLSVRTIQTHNVRHMSILGILNPHSQCPYGIRCYVPFDHAATRDGKLEHWRDILYQVVLPVMLCQRFFIILFCSVLLFLCFPFSLSLQHIILNIHFATVLYGSQKYFCCKKRFCMCKSMYLMLANKMYLYFEGGTVYLFYIYIYIYLFICFVV